MTAIFIQSSVWTEKLHGVNFKLTDVLDDNAFIP
jgi:hypothetical protein